MKQLSIQCSVAGIAFAIILFLITVQVAFAQTATQLQTITIDVNNVRSERPLDALRNAPTPTLRNDTKDVRKTEVRTIRIEDKDRVTPEPQSFLDKARSTLQERRDGLQNNDKNERAVTKVNEQKKDRISGFLSNIKRKIDAAISRLKQLSERIESRIIKSEELGIDMTQAKQLLEVANSDIENAVENITVAVKNAREAFETSISRDSFGSVVSELSKAKEHLRNAHSSLVEVIRIMKAGLSDDKKEDSNRVEADETN